MTVHAVVPSTASQVCLCFVIVFVVCICSHLSDGSEREQKST